MIFILLVFATELEAVEAKLAALGWESDYVVADKFTDVKVIRVDCQEADLKALKNLQKETLYFKSQKE